MKATLNVGTLLSAVDKGMASNSIPPKNIGAMADFGKLTISEDGVRVRTSAQNSSSLCSLDLSDGEVVEVTGSCVISMSKLKAMLKPLKKDGQVSLAYHEERKDDTVGSVVFRSGKSSWKMPAVHEGCVADANADRGCYRFKSTKTDISKTIRAVAYAGNLKDANFIQSNVCISIHDGHVYFGATDEVRCAISELKVEDDLTDVRFLIPIAATSPLLRSFDNESIEVYSDEDSVTFVQGGHEVNLSLPAESDVSKFPKFEGLVGAQQKAKIRVMASRFSDIVAACNNMNGEEALMRVDGDKIEVYSYDSIDGMSYNSSVNCAGDHVEIAMGMCPLYLVEFLKVVDEEVLFVEFPVVSGKPRHIKLSDEEGHFFLMKALVDLIHLPPQIDKDA